MTRLLCACVQDIQEVGRARVWDAYLQLVQSLTSSELVELPANTGYRHCSSAVLLRGVIRTSGSHCSVVCKTPAGGARPHKSHTEARLHACHSADIMSTYNATPGEHSSFWVRHGTC